MPTAYRDSQTILMGSVSGVRLPDLDGITSV
jgi:hypothetical protein